MHNYVTALAENGLTMAGPAGLVPAPMFREMWFIVLSMYMYIYQCVHPVLMSQKFLHCSALTRVMRDEIRFIFCLRLQHMYSHVPIPRNTARGGGGGETNHLIAKHAIAIQYDVKFDHKRQGIAQQRFCGMQTEINTYFL